MPEDTVEVNVVVIDDDVFYQVASRLLVGIIRHGRLERPSENLLPICRQALEKMATMTLNEFVNKLDQPLWEQLIVADKRPGMAITMYALHDIWVDVLIQTLDSDEWQVRKGEDLTKPPSVGWNLTSDLQASVSAGPSRIPKAPRGPKPISSTEPSPGSSPSKIPRRSKKIPTSPVEVIPEPAPKTSRKASPRSAPKPLPKVIPKPSLFRKRPSSPGSPHPRRKRSLSREGQSSSKKKSRPAEAISSSKKKTPPPDPLQAGGGVRERIRMPYGGTSTSGLQNVPEETVPEKERHKTKEDAKSPGNVSASSSPKNAYSFEAQAETKKQEKKPQPGTREASPTTPVILEVRERPRVPYSWKPGGPLKTEPAMQPGYEPTRKVPEAPPENEQNSVKPKHPEQFEREPPTRVREEYEVRPIPPTPGPKQRQQNVKKTVAKAGTDVEFAESQVTAQCARGFGKETSEPTPNAVMEEDAAQVKPEPHLEDQHDPLQAKSKESSTTRPKPSADPASDPNHTPSHVMEGQPELQNAEPKRSEPSKRRSHRSKRNSEIGRDLQSRTSLGPIPFFRPKSHWVSYYRKPTISHQDPIWDNSELWAYFRSLLRVNDEEIYSPAGPENPDFQPLPAPLPAPVGEPGPLVPYHELPERLQPKPVAGTGFVTPTTPFRVGFVTSILDPKVLRQRCLGRRGGAAEEEEKAGFNEGEYAERSKNCYHAPLGVESLSDDSGDERPEGGKHRSQGQETAKPEVGGKEVEDQRPESEHSGRGKSEADQPEAGKAAAGLSHASMAEPEFSEPESPGAFIPVFDYARDQEHEAKELELHEPITPTEYAEPIGVISDDAMAKSTRAENHEMGSDVDESQAGAMEAERVNSDYSDSESSGAESSEPETYDAENLVIDEYGDEDEDHEYRPEDYEGEEYEVELEEAEDD